MDKTLNFSIFKEKIIKTDDLLGVLLEKNKTLDKAQQWTRQLKLKFDLSKNEINKLKLRNEALTNSLKSVENNYSSLQVEHEKLKKKFDILEDKSNRTISDLQLNYQLAHQKLNQCEADLAAFKSVENQMNVKKKASPVKMKTAKEKEQVIQKDTQLYHQIAQLKSEKESLKKDKVDLHLEIYELKKKFCNAYSYEEQQAQIENELKNKEQELEQIRKTFDDSIKNKDDEISRLLDKIKNLEVEIERVKEDNYSRQVEISILQNYNIDKQDQAVQVIFEDELKLEVPLCVEQQTVAEISENKVEEVGLETPPSRIDDPTIVKTPTDEEIHQIMQQMMVPSRVSPMPSIEKMGEISPLESSYINEAQLKPPDTNQTTTRCNPNLESIVNNRRRMLKNRRRIAKSRSKKVDLLAALLALKEANIDFYIGNNSLVRFSTYLPEPINHVPPTLYTKVKSVKKKKTISCELNCPLLCCSISYMVLKQCDDEEPPLLGFFGVKNENPLKQKWDIDNLIPVLHNSPNKRKKTDHDKCNESSEEITIGHSTEIKPTEVEIVEKGIDDHETVEITFRQPTSKLKQVQRGKRKNGSIISVLTRQKLAATKKSKLSVSNLNDTAYSDEPTIALDRNSEITQPKTNSNKKSDEVIFKKPIVIPKSPKTSYKRPVCSTRRSPRLITTQPETQSDNIVVVEKIEESIELESPQSPVQHEPSISDKPVLIPLEKAPDIVNKLATSKIEVLFNKLIVFGAEEEASNAVVREFAFQEPEFVAEAILERIAADYNDAPDSKYHPAPLMTDVQRTMLGFMSKLEKTSVVGVFNSYLTLAERRLLTSQNLQEFGPITRLYLAICKLQKNLSRMRRLCCDVFYFCGDFAVPFLFTVLTSWTEVLPHEANSKNMPIARVLVQIVYMKDCNTPGYNLMQLRDLLIKFYGYPTERWNENEFFKELLDEYFRNPVRSSDFALLLYCKNRPEKWVYEKIEENLKPIVNQIPKENFKAAVIILIGNLYRRFSSKSEVNYLPKIKEWFRSLLTATTPDVVRRSIYLCLNRLKKS